MANIPKKLLSLLLVLAMILPSIPFGVTAREASADNGVTLAGKTISILGDSISTFTGVSNDTSVNATLAGGAIYYSAGTLGVNRADTWWQQTIDALGLELLVNNSWSGSCVLHTRSGTAGAYSGRCVQLHNDKTGEEPDIIAVFLGTNDFSYYQSALGTADIDYDTLITDNLDGTFSYAVPSTTCEAYAVMLHKMALRYPDAEVYCMTMLPRRDPVNSGADVGQPTAFNRELTKIIHHFGFTPVDLENCGITSDPANFDGYITDKRVHPGPEGMGQMAKALVSALTGENATLYDITYQLSGAVSDNTASVTLSGGSYSASLSLPEGYEDLSVSVTMGGKDITESCYSGGRITVPSVTGDIVITASARKLPEAYRWEFDGSDLTAVAGGNTLTKKAGTTADGVLSNTYYQLKKQVVLYHDRPWAVEWKASGTSWSGMLFSSAQSAGTNGNTFLFKTTSNTGLIAFGERANGQYENYGVPLTALGVDTAAAHVYRVENRIAADGSNMAYLFVDGTFYGPMNSFYIGGTSSQNKTVDWLSGKDFTFSYIGAASHPITGCALEYITVWERSESAASMSMKYDDRLDMSGKSVEILDAGTPTSYQVGYGIGENTVPDTSVVTLDGNTLIATGTGNAKVMIDGATCEITVTAAPISLLLLAGQSMMQGSEGDANQSIVCPQGQVYSTYGDRYTMTADSAASFAPSALTGAGSEVNVNGTTEHLKDWPVYLLNEAGAGKAGPDSGIAYEWAKQTGEKVWVVNAAHGGTSISVWQPGTAQYEECRILFSACQETLRREIAAGHYTLSHMGCLWRQGAADELQSPQWYTEKFLTMWESMKQDFSLDMDGDGTAETPEFINISMEMAGHVGKTGYRYAAGAFDPTDSSFFSTYEELEMRGHRVAQYWMAANPQLPDINLVCNIDAQWLTMPDGSDGVVEYFAAHYPNGKIDYTTQVLQSSAWYTPTTPWEVKDSIHFNQIGFNEMGIESARNTLILLGMIPDTEEKTAVTFHNWTGYETVSSLEASTVGISGTLVVPVVSPCYRSKEVTYQVSEGLHYDYYDLTADAYNTSGTLTAVGADGSVTVKERTLMSYSWDLENGLLVSTGTTENTPTRLEGTTENGVFIDTRYQLARPFLLLDDQSWVLEWKMTGPWCDEASPIGKKLFSTDGAQATPGVFSLSVHGVKEYVALGYYSEGGHQNYGVDLTGHGISISDTHTYRLVNRVEDSGNTVWLFVDGVEIAPMTTFLNDGTESHYLSGLDFSFGYLGTPRYLLDNGSIEYITVTESSSGEDIHFHDWSDWQTVTVPTADAPGCEQRQCPCGETQSRNIDGAWQKYALASHISQLPETLCCGVNLWSRLEHDLQYFSSSYAWTVHPSGNTASVTIPVEPGDRIWATSFGAAGENGGAKNGIRLTFFDAYGVCASLSPAQTYEEFAKNGWITAPEGAVAANISMWTKDDSNELYILNAAHTYSGTFCTACGAVHPNAANYKGKVVSILSASTSTFAGYIPTADGFNLEHRPRYPQDNLLTDVNETWWMQLINQLDAKLGINDSWAGSQVLNTLDANAGDLGPDAAMASMTRIQNLGANGDPDLILFFGAGNDMGRSVPLGSFDPAAAPTTVDLTATKWETLADAYTAAIMRLQHTYPDAQIVAVTTYAMPSYATAAKLNKYIPVLKAICDHYGVPTVDLRDSGVTFAMLPDNIHPNAEGMDYITEAVLNKLLNDIPVESGENTVYAVSHELSNAVASLGYYKGVSAGAAFTETLTGDELTVTVTMGGVDITADVYEDGKIAIPEVTGDIVITAKAAFNADGHLQQLPEEICPGTNLWTALEPENIYYTASGWGNTAAGTTWSVTFPVEPGARLWATAFGAYPGNGSSANGVRVTWFNENGVLKTVSRDAVYSEFAANGWLTAPDGAVAVNIPMTNNRPDYALYLLSAEHSYKSTVTPPTCTEAGFTTHTCTVCGNSYVTGETAVLGHNPGTPVEENRAPNGSYDLVTCCIECGKELHREHIRGTLPGDVNADGKVNNRDATRLLQYLAGWAVTVDPDAADVTGDGKLSNRDVTRLLQYLAGWSVTLH